MILELETLTKIFDGPGGSVRAVDGVSLTVESGEFVAVQGSSGSGKSTLLLAAGGLMRPTIGKVAVAGTDPYALSADARARFRAAKIGFVFQQFHLIPYLSLLDNILTASLASGKRGAGERARELVKRFGLEERARHVPSELSTGERQRAALARAFLNEPRLLLADEPTGNLDRRNAETVLEALAAFADSGGAVLLVTHDARAAGYAGRTLRMEEGRIVGG